MKQRTAIVLSFMVAAGGLANVICAATFGAVLSRFSSGWVFFRDEPIGFLVALILSLIAFVGFSLISWAMILSVRSERRHWARISSLAPIKDNSKVSMNLSD
jgi:hypothetical protein